MMSFASQLSGVLTRLNLVIESGVSELAPSTASISAKAYLDPKTFAEEKKLLFKTDVPLSALGDIVEGTVHSIRSNTDAILIAKNSGGDLRVFRNRCRHRGAALLPDGASCRGALTCPYHAWTYDAGGKLRSIYGNKHGVQDWQNLGLEEVPSRVDAGFVWSRLKPGTDDAIQNIFEDLRLLGFQSPRVIAEFILSGQFNWKIGVEAFLEVYHFKIAHGEKLRSLPIHNVALFDLNGPHARIIVPVSTESSYSISDLKKKCHIMYFFFPNHFFLIFEDHFGWLTILPNDVESCSVKYRGLSFDEPSQALSEKIQRSVSFLRDLILEDVAICNSIQDNLRENTDLIFTRYESALIHFHQSLERLLNANL